MRTTVLVPLHRSAAWRSSISEQLSVLQGVANIVVSDADELDDTLRTLRSEQSTGSAIAWLGARDLRRGWVAHCNDLLAHATTEFVMWLPHDDRIDGDWILEAEQELDRRPDAVAACGSIRALHVDSRGRGVAVNVPHFVDESDTQARLVAAVDSLLAGRTGDLGVLFRSVTRRALVPPLPAGLHNDEWSDVLWALQLLNLGPIVMLDAKYGKRWHDTNTHSKWRDHGSDPELLRRGVARTLAGPAHHPTTDVLASAWANDVLRMQRAFERELKTERELAARAIHDLQIEFERSHSWRMTAPLRRLRTLMRGVARR